MLNIPYLSFPDLPWVEHLSPRMDELDRQSLQFAPWLAFDYRPNVSFSIAHNGVSIFLKYYVEEQAIVAIHSANGAVYKDSCVEFFIDFDDGTGYYNIECNCVGACYVGFGQNKTKRLVAPRKIIEQIKSQTLIRPGMQDQNSMISWELTLIIPVEIFVHHQITTLTNQVCRVNFYKCGDDLPQPHYLSWTVIKSESPNFHLPQFFKAAAFGGTEDILASAEVENYGDKKP